MKRYIIQQHFITDNVNRLLLGYFQHYGINYYHSRNSMAQFRST